MNLLFFVSIFAAGGATSPPVETVDHAFRGTVTSQDRFTGEASGGVRFTGEISGAVRYSGTVDDEP